MRTTQLIMLAGLVAGLAAISGAYGTGLVQFTDPSDSITAEVTRCYYEVTGDNMHHSMQYAITNNSTLTLTSAEIQTQLVRTDTEQERVWVIDAGISMPRLWPGQTLERTAEIDTERIDGEFECRALVSNQRFDLIQDIIALQTENANLKAEMSGLKAQISNMADTISNLTARITAIEGGTTPPDPPPEPDPPEPTWWGIQGKVYRDANWNEVFDEGEAASNNPLIMRIHSTGESFDKYNIMVNRTTTDANGDYSLKVMPPPGYVPWTNYLWVENGGTHGVSFGAEEMATNDIRIPPDYQPRSPPYQPPTPIQLPSVIQGTVYWDENGNDIPDAGEGVPNWPVQQGSSNGFCDGIGFGYTLTDASGNYLVELESIRMTERPCVMHLDAHPGLKPPSGERILVFKNATVTKHLPLEVEPCRYAWLPIWTEPSVWAEMPCGQSAPTGVQGKVYQDSNGNGVLDAGEPGVQGLTVLTVSLSNPSDVSRLTTDANGGYSIGLDAGGYLVQIEGGGPQGYSYVDITEGQMLVLNLIP